MNKRHFLKQLVAGSLFLSIDNLLSSCSSIEKKKKPFLAFDIEFNYGEGGVNAFLGPGVLADADPKEQIKWYKDMGCTIVQTFAVSCNGYAWYKNGFVPETPGLKHDFLTEMVRLGHQEGMEVYGYFCAGANTKWGLEHPDMSYGTPAVPHIPFTRQYLDYLGKSITDAVKKTGMDGFMIDWIWHPLCLLEPYPPLRWIDCEKEMYKELMNTDFPGVEQLTKENIQIFRRRAIERCWNTIYKSAREGNPKCKIWVTCCQVTSQDLVGSSMFKQADVFMNEAGTIEDVEKLRPLVGEHTQLVTCLALWNNQDPAKIVPEALKRNIGLYGFAHPTQGYMLPPISHYLSQPIDKLKGEDKIIAYLAKTYNSIDL